LKKILALFFSLVIAINLNAKDETTNFTLKGGLYGNLNLYNADFEYFNVYRMYHSGFSSASGIDFSLMLGGEYDMSNDIFGFDTKYSFELLYSGLNASLINKDLLGYDIGVDDYDGIYADYVIEPTVNVIITEQALKAYLLKNIPISLKTGVFLGIPLSPEFKQYTELVSPDDVRFENGTKIANEYAGAIPDAASVIFGLTFGLGYDFEYNNSFIFTPEIKFNYGLSNISSQVNWKINTLQAGISVHYNIPKAKVPPPAKPPMPLAPLTTPPPAEAIAKIDINITENGKSIDNKIEYDYIVNEYYKKELVIPVIFINENIEGYDKNYNPDEILKLAAEKLKNDNSKIIISAGIENDNDQEQIDRIISDFKKNGIKNEQIIVKTESIAEKKFKYPELKAEAKSLKLTFDNGDDILIKNYLSDKEISIDDKEILININVSNIENYNFNAYVNIGDDKISLNEDDNIIELKKYFNPDENISLNIVANVTDDWNNTFNEEKTISVNPFMSVEKFINYNPNNEKSTFTIGFFDFDSEEIYGVDDDLKLAIDDALNNDKEIKLIALTDNLGIDSYNKRLALRRAEAALNELGLNRSQVTVEIQEGGLYDNSTPYGRMLNRSVIIEIK
jgi:hypothetical protein